MTKIKTPSQRSSRALSFSLWTAVLLLAGLCGALRFRGSLWAELSVWFLLALLPGALCGLHHDLKRNRNTDWTAGLGAATSVAFGFLVKSVVEPSFVFMPLGIEIVVLAWSSISFIIGVTVAFVLRKTVLHHLCHEQSSV